MDGGALLLPLLLALTERMCNVCKGEGGEIEGLVPIILPARPVLWVSLRPCTTYSAASSAIPTLASNRGLGALKPGSSGLSQI